MVLVAVAGVYLAGCDSCVYAEGELAAENRFRTIRIGEPEERIVSLLGQPAAVITQGENERISVEVHAEGETTRHLLDRRDRSAWPNELRFLPSHVIGGKVLVYVEGTVFAYYFINQEGRVEFLDVSMS